MYWQKQVLYKANSLSAGVDQKFDLPKSGLLGSLILMFDGTFVSGYGLTGGAWRVIDKITKLVVQHGSTPELALTGLEAQGLSAYDQNMVDPSTRRNYGASENFEWLLLNFGRSKGDVNLGLDLAMWDNTQLIISNNFVAASDIATLTVTIVGLFLVDAPARQFVGHLNKQEWFEWTTVQAELRNFNIPDADIIRRVMLQAIPAVNATTKRANCGMHYLMSNVKLAFKNRNEVLCDIDSRVLMRDAVYDNYGLWIAGGQPYLNAAKAFYGVMGHRIIETTGAIVPHGVAAPSTIPTIEASTDFTEESITYDGATSHGFVEIGVAPYNVFGINFDLGGDPSSWLDPAAKRPITLDIQTQDDSTAASGRNAVLLEVYKPH